MPTTVRAGLWEITAAVVQREKGARGREREREGQRKVRGGEREREGQREGERGRERAREGERERASEN